MSMRLHTEPVCIRVSTMVPFTKAIVMLKDTVLSHQW